MILGTITAIHKLGIWRLCIAPFTKASRSAEKLATLGLCSREKYIMTMPLNRSASLKRRSSSRRLGDCSTQRSDGAKAAVSEVGSNYCARLQSRR